ncbi:MAG: CPBP family glutamic-type intramembrane protease [Leptolyngbyaceae bacterium]|nr:CPBP family glutamic-type intramembrane protease [Leptolyngbyaceae bacterium]
MTHSDSDPSPNPNPNTLTRIEVLMAMAITAIVLLVISRLWLYLAASTFLPLGWHPKLVATGILLGLAITGVSGLVYRWWPAYQVSADLYLAMVLPSLVWPDLIWLGLLPGLSEELLFRGVMLPSFGLNWFGVLLSSGIFGVMHFSGIQQWPYILWASIIGVVLGGSVVLTHSLVVPIIAHIVTNLLSSCLWKWQQPSAQS